VNTAAGRTGLPAVLSSGGGMDCVQSSVFSGLSLSDPNSNYIVFETVRFAGHRPEYDRRNAPCGCDAQFSRSRRSQPVSEPVEGIS